MLSPSITADTDDRVLIETNVPISRFIPHSRRRSLTGLTLSVLSLSHFLPFLSLLTLLWRNLFIITQQADSLCKGPPRASP